MAEIPFDWYALIEANAALEQGDILLNVPVFEPDIQVIDLAQHSGGERVSYEIDVKKYDLIIMTQSCDFLKLSESSGVICCVTSSYSDATQQSDWNKGVKWSDLRKGNVVELHLINKCDIEGHEFDYQIVNLREVITLPFGYLKNIAIANGDRIRLLPPYREHLSQAFARLFMRVGLPIDLPEKP